MRKFLAAFIAFAGLSFAQVNPTQIPFSSSGGSGASSTAQLTDLQVIRTNSTKWTIGASCAVTATPCNVRFGDIVFQITTSATVDVASGTGTVFFYIDALTHRVTAGGNAFGLTCSAGCDVATPVTSYPVGMIPLQRWTIVTGVIDASPGVGIVDDRAFLSTKNVSGGTGIVCTAGTASTVCSIDPATSPGHHPIGIIFDGGGSALTSGATHYLVVPFACTIFAWNILVDTGTATLKTWRKATGTAIPTVADTISTSGVAISSGTSVRSTTVSDFTSTAIVANDIIAFNLFAVSSATQVTFIIECNQ